MIYCHLWPVFLTYFSTLSYKWHDFQKKSTGHKMCVLIFCTIFIWNVSQPKQNSARHYHKFGYVFMQSSHYSGHILIKLEFSWHIFKKYSNMKFHENPISETPTHSTQTDGQTVMTKLTVAFCHSVTAPKKPSVWLYHKVILYPSNPVFQTIYEGWNFNSGNYLFTTDTK